MRSTILAIVIIGLLIPVRGLSFGTMSSRSSDSALIVMPEQPRNEDSSHYPLGLSFRVGREYPFFQSINQNSGNYMMFVGLRYTLAPSFSVDLDFSTGTEHHTQPGIPLNQQSDMYFLGGVSIGLAARIFPEQTFHPDFSIGYDRVTILQNGSGYNGNGVILQGGYEYLHPSDIFSLYLNGFYQIRRYVPYSGNPSPAVNADSYTQSSAGISLTILIHFQQML